MSGVEEFCRGLRPQLVGTLGLYTGDRQVAEELAQETLARVWVHWPRVRRLDAPEAWAHRVALNLANSYFRRRAAERRARARGGEAVDTRHVDVDTAAAVAVRHALMALPRRQRTALVLRFYADLPVAEVAHLMGCPTGTVKSLTSRALAALRDHGDLVEPQETTDAR